MHISWIRSWFTFFRPINLIRQVYIYISAMVLYFSITFIDTFLRLHFLAPLGHYPSMILSTLLTIYVTVGFFYKSFTATTMGVF